MSDDLSFSIKVNTEMTYSEFIDATYLELRRMGIPTNGLIETQENRIVVRKNPHYAKGFTDQEDGWFYYPYEVNITAKPITDESRQEEFAKHLVNFLKSLNCEVKITGGFEDIT